MILIALVFLVPIWRITASKGYNGKAFVLAAGIPAAIAQSIGVMIESRSETFDYLITAGVPASPRTPSAAARSSARPGPCGS